MRCGRVQDLYEDYTRGELALGTLARVEEHLSGCPECREQYELNDGIAAELRGAGEVAHPGDDYFDQLTRGVLARAEAADAGADGLADLGRPMRGGTRGLWWAGAAAAAVLVGLGVAPVESGTRELAQAVDVEVEPAASQAEAVVAMSPAPVASTEPTVRVVTSEGRRELVFPSLEQVARGVATLAASVAEADEGSSQWGARGGWGSSVGKHQPE